MTDPPVSEPVVGFVGLGNMGGQLCANLVAAGQTVVAYDAAGPARVPAGATPADSVADLARRVDVVVCSLPDGAVSESVAREIVATPDRRVTHVVDTSTMGVRGRTVVGRAAPRRGDRAAWTRRCRVAWPGRRRARWR